VALAPGVWGATGAPRLDPGGVGARRAYTVASWSTKDGLPADRVRHLWQDAQGFMWIATFNGVSRVDGVRFRDFDVSNTPGLPADYVTALVEDREGNSWIGAGDAGVCRLRPSSIEMVGPPVGGETGRSRR
jgi:ligand-binding sensor domain-containing protein